jgi:hypothetical protein
MIDDASAVQKHGGMISTTTQYPFHEFTYTTKFTYTTIARRIRVFIFTYIAQIEYLRSERLVTSARS